MKTIIIIPIFNEKENIQKVLKELIECFKSTDILIINDGSVDGTRPLLPHLHAEAYEFMGLSPKDSCGRINVNYIDIPVNIGYPLALHTGYKYAHKNNYDYLIQFDGDGQHIATEALKLLEVAQKSDADIVIGSRFKSPNLFEYTIPRRMVKYLLEKLIKTITDNKLTDPTSGLQVINNKVIKHYAEMEEFPQYADANLIITMILEKFKVVEHSVKMRKRQNGIGMYETMFGPTKYIIINLYNILIILIKLLKVKR